MPPADAAEVPARPEPPLPPPPMQCAKTAVGVKLVGFVQLLVPEVKTWTSTPGAAVHPSAAPEASTPRGNCVLEQFAPFAASAVAVLAFPESEHPEIAPADSEHVDCEVDCPPVPEKSTMRPDVTAPGERSGVTHDSAAPLASTPPAAWFAEQFAPFAASAVAVLAFEAQVFVGEPSCWMKDPAEHATGRPVIEDHGVLEGIPALPP